MSIKEIRGYVSFIYLVSNSTPVKNPIDMLLKLSWSQQKASSKFDTSHNLTKSQRGNEWKQ